VRDYVDLTYGSLPRTDYPAKLVRYMLERIHWTDCGHSKKMLDVGYGRGEHLEEFVAQGLKCDGLDSCHRDIPGAHTETWDVDENGLPWSDEDWFDLIWCKSVLEHMYRPDGLVLEMARSLAPGGVLITMTPPVERCGLKAFYAEFQHHHPFTLEGLRSIHQWAGLDILEARYFFQVPITWRHRWLLPLMMAVHHLTPLKRWSKSVEFAGWRAPMALVVARKPE